MRATPARFKSAIAKRLLADLPNSVVLWQVGCEYIAASRKLEPLGYSIEDAWAELRRLRILWQPVFPTEIVWDRANVLFQRYSLSFWDALLVAACLEGGVKRLYSEDFGAYPNIDGLEIVDPFK